MIRLSGITKEVLLHKITGKMIDLGDFSGISYQQILDNLIDLKIIELKTEYSRQYIHMHVLTPFRLTVKDRSVHVHGYTGNSLYCTDTVFLALAPMSILHNIQDSKPNPHEDM